jgi:hypothetical protein
VRTIVIGAERTMPRAAQHGWFFLDFYQRMIVLPADHERGAAHRRV